jgi:hypothetical protein
MADQVDLVCLLGGPYSPAAFDSEPLLLDRANAAAKYCESYGPCVVVVSGTKRQPGDVMSRAEMSRNLFINAVGLSNVGSKNKVRQVILDRSGKTTFEEATGLRTLIGRKFKYQTVRSLVVVTSDFHARRSQIIFNRVFPNLEVAFELVPSDPSQFSICEATEQELTSTWLYETIKKYIPDAEPLTEEELAQPIKTSLESSAGALATQGVKSGDGSSGGKVSPPVAPPVIKTSTSDAHPFIHTSSPARKGNMVRHSNGNCVLCVVPSPSPHHTVLQSLQHLLQRFNQRISTIAASLNAEAVEGGTEEGGTATMSPTDLHERALVARLAESPAFFTLDGNSTSSTTPSTPSSASASSASPTKAAVATTASFSAMHMVICLSPPHPPPPPTHLCPLPNLDAPTPPLFISPTPTPPFAHPSQILFPLLDDSPGCTARASGGTFGDAEWTWDRCHSEMQRRTSHVMGSAGEEGAL